MKRLMIAIAMLGTTATASVFAQSNPSAAPSSAASNTNYVSQQNASYSQPIMSKTRAEVYQELVQAEQDGSLAKMNATTYAHH